MTQSPNTSEAESSAYTFNARELARLAVYRAAVAARFYTDQCDQPGERIDFDSLRLFDARRTSARAA